MPVHNPRHSRFFWRSSAMFCILDAERLFREVNAAWEKTLGLSTGQLLAKSFLEFVHADDQPSTQYYFDQLDTGITSVSFACRFCHHDGSYRQILWEVNGAASVEYAYYAVGLDITGREQPMVADEMISVLQEGVVLQYANGTIGACNPSSERILGLSAEQMMGWTLVDPDWKVIHEDGSPFPPETHPAICTLRTGQAYADVIMGIVKPDETTTWIRVNSYPLWRDDVTMPYAVVISFSDMTAYKRAERTTSKEIDHRAPVTPDNNYDLWDWNLETNEVSFSPRWKTMLGYEEHELTNHVDTWHQRIHPADYKRVIADIQNHLDGMTRFCENTHRVQHKDGSYRWIMSRAVLVRDPSGNPHRMVGTHVDVTEPRRIEEELQDTEKKYRQIMEVESDALFIVDAETTDILDVNKAATRMYGYSRNELLKARKIELSAQPEKMEKTIKKGVKYTSQQYHRKQDGTVFPVEVTASPFVWKGKHVLMIAVRDITERQKVETALWESESKYRQLFEASSIPTVVLDANTQDVFDVNHAAIDLYGYSKEEWLNMKTEDVSAEPAKKRAAFSTTGNKRGQTTIPLRWHRKKDGTVFPVEISTGNTYLFQGRSLICATIRDIAERKTHEEALRTERDFINTLVQASPAFFFAINPDGKIRMINKAMLMALEYALEEVIDKDYLVMFVPENERSLVSNEFEALIKTMQPSLMESHVMSKAGKMLLVEWHSRAIVKANGLLDYFFGVGIDVTERKKAQGHLRLFKSIIESSAEAIAINSPDGHLVYVNPAHEKLFGRAFKESRQTSYRDYYPPDILEIWDNQVIPALSRGGSWEGELKVFDSTGNIFPVWERVDAIRDTAGNILFSFGLMHDISERQRMWETLRRQWEEHQMIFNTVPAMIWYRDNKNQLLRSNDLVLKTFGENEELAREYTDCTAVLQSGNALCGAVYSYRNLAKEIRWMQVDKIPYRDAQGEIIGIIIFAVDVTEHRQAQVSLQTSEERMYLVVEHMPMMLNALDADGNILLWNRASEEITGYRVDEIVGNANALELLFLDPLDRQQMLNKWNTNDDVNWETRLTCKGGVVKTIAWSSVCRRFPVPGWHIWYLGQDVTQRRQETQSSQVHQSLLAQVLTATRLGVCLSDDRGRILQVNRAYADLYGYSQEELAGQPFTLILPADAHSTAVREYYSLLMTRDEPTLLKRRGEQDRKGCSFDMQVMASRVVLEDRRRLLISIVSKVNE